MDLGHWARSTWAYPSNMGCIFSMDWAQASIWVFEIENISCQNYKNKIEYLIKSVLKDSQNYK